MFQRAPPDVNGFGVITETSSRTRSSQSWMSFGLPPRTVNATTEVCGLPPYVLGVPVVLGDEAGVDEPGHVGLERQVDDVGGLAGLDRARLIAGGAERVRELDVGADVFWKSGSRAPLVDLLRGRVGDEVDVAADGAAELVPSELVESSLPQAADAEPEGECGRGRDRRAKSASAHQGCWVAS